MLHQQLIPVTKDSFLIIMRVCHGLLAASTLLALASLVFMFMSGSTWLYRASIDARAV